MKEKTLAVTFVNVGYGEAILLECPDLAHPDGVFTALIDGGPAVDSEFADRSSGRIRIEEYLKKRGIRQLDLAVSTHIHEDHISGLLRAAKAAPPKELWQTLPPAFYRGMHPLDVSLARNLSEHNFLNAINDYRTLCTLVTETGGGIFEPETGRSVQLTPELSVKILSPQPKQRESLEKEMQSLYEEGIDADEFRKRLDTLDARMNNYSLILLLDYCGTRLLLPGDTNRAGYAEIAPKDLEADLFKVGHHGQIDGADEDLLTQIKPAYVVCCASSDRRYNSAHPDTMRMIADSGAKLYFSDCPSVPGIEIPAHEALTFTIGEQGILNADYIAKC